MMRKLGFFAVLFLLAGCVKPITWVGVLTGEVVVQERLSVRADGVWSRLEGLPAPKHEIWTADGITLDQLHFHTGIAEGESLVVVKEGPAAKPIPRFRADMQADEVVEFYGVFASHDGSAFKLEKLAPCRFAEQNGFRWEFSRTRKFDDVRTRGVGYGVISGGQLYLLVFEAPRIHYFAKHAGRVEALAQSARLKKP